VNFARVAVGVCHLLEGRLYHVGLVNEPLLEISHAVITQFERLLAGQLRVLDILNVQLDQERFQVIHLLLLTLGQQLRLLPLLYDDVNSNTTACLEKPDSAYTFKQLTPNNPARVQCQQILEKRIFL